MKFRALLFPIIGLAFSACASAPQYDAIIRGGTVYDGSGAPGAAADIAIMGDRIAKVGDLSRARSAMEIDASGKAVAPGFINVLSWATETLIEDGRGERSTSRRDA
jgi:N-acyl-D-amino-acid deacylase